MLPRGFLSRERSNEKRLAKALWSFEFLHHKFVADLPPEFSDKLNRERDVVAPARFLNFPDVFIG